MTTPPRKRAGAKRPSGKGRAAGKTARAAAREDRPAGPAPEGPADEDKEKPAAEAASAPAADRETRADGPAVLASPPPPARAAGLARALAWVTLTAGLAVGIAAVTWPWWSERLAGVFPFLAADGAPAISQLAGRVQALERQARSLESENTGTLQQLEQERARFQEEIKTLMARLARVEQAAADARDLVKAADAPAGTTMAAESLKALAARIDEIEKDQAELARGADPDSRTALDAIAARLKRLEQVSDGRDATDDAAARAIVLAVAQLRDAVRRGTPFAADLEALKALADGRPAIDQALAALTPLAAAGVPTLAVLRTRFAGLAGPIVTVAGTAGGDGWIAEAAAKLSSLVTVRRVGDAAPEDSVDALVARVDTLLAAGDLDAAVGAIKLLKGKPADLAAPWLSAAAARLAAERAVAGLHVHALSLLAPAKAGG